MMPPFSRFWRAVGLLSLPILLLALAGCSAAPPDCHSPDVLCIGFVTGSGGLKDYGLNEQAWQSLAQLRDEGIVVDVIDSVDSLDYEKNIVFFVEHGYDMVFTGGFSLAETTLSMARKHPQVAFVMIGQPPPESVSPPNLAGVVFPEGQAGFWAGALAAHFSETRIVGAVFANQAIPTVAAYARGFEAGAQDVDAQVVFYTEGRFADSLNDREWGFEQADNLYNDRRADVLFAYGGATGLAALEQFQGRVIGVEMDFARRYPSMRERLVASIIFDFSIIQEIARAGRVSQEVYQGEYRVLWGDTPAPEVLESIEYPGEDALTGDEDVLETDDEMGEDSPADDTGGQDDVDGDDGNKESDHGTDDGYGEGDGDDGEGDNNDDNDNGG